jgi:hypothetical protein
MLVPGKNTTEEGTMAAPFLRSQDPGHSAMLNWALILMGALLAWLLWPGPLP